MTRKLISESALPLTLALAESRPGDAKADFNTDREFDTIADFYDPKSQVTAWPEEGSNLHPLMTLGGGLRTLCLSFDGKIITDDSSD